MIDVISTGIATSVVDAGRGGRGSIGQSRGGAVDLDALQLANRLVGNAPDAAGFETSGGLTLRVASAAMVAITGAAADIDSSGPPVGWGAPASLPAGTTLRIGRVRDGARTYVALRGGVMASDGRWRVGPDPGLPAASEVAVPRPRLDVVDLWPGPRRDWFTEEAWSSLVSSTFTVEPDSNRVGVRLGGPSLDRIERRELPSEGLIEGAIQVPPSGQPIVMLADHPTTGGYPVIAVVDPSHLSHIAQLAAGQTIRFRPIRG